MKISIHFIVFRWVHNKKGVQISKSREDRFDQPEESAQWLKLTREINTDFLSKVIMTMTLIVTSLNTP